ncbi:MAG TPA: PadR family transcriptional regulator [Gemmatimonadaceae bacterium]|nr:PadR family transcriptional regulator [Gemmatimonadaceae bacterium]
MPRIASPAVPLTSAALHIMLALAEGDRHGYAIAREIETMSKGSVRMGPGTLYGTLQRLVAAELVEPSAAQHRNGDDQRRRYYRLTARGRSTLKRELDRLAGLLAAARRRRLLDHPRPEAV